MRKRKVDWGEGSRGRADADQEEKSLRVGGRDNEVVLEAMHVGRFEQPGPGIDNLKFKSKNKI